MSDSALSRFSCATAEGMPNKKNTRAFVWNDPIDRPTRKSALTVTTTECCAVSPYGVNSSFSSTTIVVSDGSGCTVSRALNLEAK